MDLQRSGTPAAESHQRSKMQHGRAVEGQEYPHFPNWFLNNCVWTADELATSQPKLQLIEDTGSGLSQQGENGAPRADLYDIDRCVYDGLWRYVVSTSDASVGWAEKSTERRMFFREDCIIVRLPRGVLHGSKFFEAIASHFARDIGAGLIRLGSQDLVELTRALAHADTTDLQASLVRFFHGERDCGHGDSEDSETETRPCHTGSQELKTDEPSEDSQASRKDVGIQTRSNSDESQSSKQPANSLVQRPVKPESIGEPQSLRQCPELHKSEGTGVGSTKAHPSQTISRQDHEFDLLQQSLYHSPQLLQFFPIALQQMQDLQPEVQNNDLIPYNQILGMKNHQWFASRLMLQCIPLQPNPLTAHDYVGRADQAAQTDIQPAIHEAQNPISRSTQTSNDETSNLDPSTSNEASQQLSDCPGETWPDSQSVVSSTRSSKDDTFYDCLSDLSTSERSAKPQVQALLNSTFSKARLVSMDRGDLEEDRPVVIHITEAMDFEKLPTDEGELNILELLRASIAETFQYSGRVLLLITNTNPESQMTWLYGPDHIGFEVPLNLFPPNLFPPNPDYDVDLRILSLLESPTSVPVLTMAPTNDQRMRGLLVQDRCREIRSTNIRKLKEAVRGCLGLQNTLPLLEPYEDDDFLEVNQNTEQLDETLLSPEEIDSLARVIARDPTPSWIQKSVQQMSQSKQVINGWLKTEQEIQQAEKWSAFPPNVREAVKFMTDSHDTDETQYEWEVKLLDLLVDPSQTTDTLADIELPLGVKDSVIQLLSHVFDEETEPYGILKRSRIRGALLYGPPGTGKTHLARILAKEATATLLLASAADMESKWTGETEKAISALFRLGRMVAPSLIFIDEADGLFRARSEQDPSWVRTRINQLLAETDGLKRHQNQPFLLLATNNPYQLDNAILRRVPLLLHLPLPARNSRQQIFEICLRDERLHQELDLSQLAAMTSGYSGSDIQNVCVQAALACQSELEAAGQVAQERILDPVHFELALRKCKPTVAKETLKSIWKFAKEFDPDSLIVRPSEVEEAIPVDSFTRPIRNAQQIEEDLSPRIKVPPLRENGDGSTTWSSKLEFKSALDQSTTKEPPVLSAQNTFYKPLNTDKREIRLLEMKAVSSRDSEVSSCEVELILHTVSLDTDPQFCALSYVWGSSANPEKICVNGEIAKIGVNLAAALRWAPYHWQQYFPDRPASGFRIWADALCINQDDMSERNHQVKMMGDIYKKADLVISSIANNNEQAELAIENLGLVHGILTKSKPRLSSKYISSLAWLQRLPQFCKADSSDAFEFKEAELLYDDDRYFNKGTHGNRSWDAHHALLSLPYWKRVWIIQEIVLSEHVLLMCDSRSILLESLQSIKTIMENSGIPSIPSVPEFFDAGVFCASCVRFTDFGALENMIRFRSIKDHNNCATAKLACHSEVIGYAATDPRDFVYGVLGLSNLDIVVDYNKSVTEVYSDFAQKQLEYHPLRTCGHFSTGPLHFLAYAGVDRWGSGSAAPTWVPNFVFQSDSHHSTSHSTSFVETPGNANDGVFSSVMINPRIEGSSLFMHCAHIGTVRKMEQLLDVRAKKRGYSSGTVTMSAYHHMRNFLESGLVYVTGITSLQAILFTLSMRQMNPDTMGVEDISHLFHVAHHTFLSSTDGEDIPVFELLGCTLSELGEYCLEHVITEDVEPFFESCFPDHPGLLDKFSREKLLPVATSAFERLDTGCLLANKSFFETDLGYIGLGPKSLMVGDEICILHNCPTPVVLRRVEDHYLFIGHCFVVGLMEGEAASLFQEGKIQINAIEIR